MFFIFSTPVLIRYLCQLKSTVFLHVVLLKGAFSSKKVPGYKSKKISFLKAEFYFLTLGHYTQLNTPFKPCLHYGQNRAKLASFKDAEYFFLFFKTH